MPEVVEGWKGREIPIEIQSYILMKYYRKAVALCAANLMGLHKMVEARMGPAEEIGQIVKALEDDPTYMRILTKFAHSFDEFGDKSFRMDNEQLAGEVVDEMDDMITWFAFQLFVEDGADIPQWMFDQYDEIEDPESVEASEEEE